MQTVFLVAKYGGARIHFWFTIYTATPSMGANNSQGLVRGAQGDNKRRRPSEESIGAHVHESAAIVRFTMGESPAPEPFSQNRLAARKRSRQAGERLPLSSITAELNL